MCRYTFQSAYESKPYTSGYIHHVTVTDLKPETKYSYQCGDSTTMSATFAFTTPPQVGPTAPFRFGTLERFVSCKKKTKKKNDYPQTQQTPSHSRILMNVPARFILMLIYSSNHDDDACRRQQWQCRRVPPDFKSKGVMGDMGQTNNSAATMQHIISGGYSATLLVGDLSYADSAWKPGMFGPCSQTRWDSWGKLVEPLAANCTYERLCKCASVRVCECASVRVCECAS